MKYEPLNLDMSGQKPLQNLSFQLADSTHIDAITDLTVGRTDINDRSKILERTEREMSLYQNGEDYAVFVALNESQVVGLCRYFHSNRVQEKNILHPGPSGIYNMGIIVHPDFRRQQVARFMHERRLNWQKSKGFTFAYSGVSIENLVSQRMHEAFRFEKIAEVPGVLSVNFDCGLGYLFRKDF